MLPCLFFSILLPLATAQISDFEKCRAQPAEILISDLKLEKCSRWYLHCFGDRPARHLCPWGTVHHNYCVVPSASTDCLEIFDSLGAVWIRPLSDPEMECNVYPGKFIQHSSCELTFKFCLNGLAHLMMCKDVMHSFDGKQCSPRPDSCSPRPAVSNSQELDEVTGAPLDTMDPKGNREKESGEAVAALPVKETTSEAKIIQL